MNSYHKAEDYICDKDKYIVDTCVLIYIFFSPSNHKNRIYAKLYSDIINNGKKIVITLNQIGELINKYINIELAIYKKDLKKEEKKSFNLKKFRKTKEYGNALDDIKLIYQNAIEPYAEIVNFKLDNEFILNIFNALKEADYNDIIYAEIASKQLIPIITDDYDFKSSESDIVIISNNGRYFTKWQQG